MVEILFYNLRDKVFCNGINAHYFCSFKGSLYFFTSRERAEAWAIEQNKSYAFEEQ